MDALVRRAKEVGLALEPARAERVWTYFRLLSKWNARMNLTGLNLTPDNRDALDRLLIEPLLAARHAGTTRMMVDVGSGGGSPAIPFAIGTGEGPRVTLIEARERKSVFLREALRETGLDGQVSTARFEQWAAERSTEEFDVATIRAVRLEPTLLSQLAGVLVPGGRLFCFHEEGKQPFTPHLDLEWGSPIELMSSMRSFLTIATKP